MKKHILFILALLILHGCSSQPKTNPAFAAQGAGNQGFSQITSQSGGIAGKSVSNNPNIYGTPITQSIPSERIIYFDFDKTDIRFNDRLVLEQHAAYLSANPQVSVRLEGHADERGSREYNLALGERRALAAKRVLNILGVDNYRINTLSYGEEMPLQFGHTETSWQRNRRVEIIYP